MSVSVTIGWAAGLLVLVYLLLCMRQVNKSYFDHYGGGE